MFKVPSKTSVWTTHHNSSENVMTFAPELIEFIKQKKKYRTYRLANEKYSHFKVGDILLIKQNLLDKPIGKAKIIERKLVKFKDLPLSTPGHETYESKERQREVFNGYYAFLGRPINDDDPFIILKFQLLKTL